MTGLPALAVAAAGFLAFMIAYLVARSRRIAKSRTTRSRRSVAGIVVQGAALAVACGGMRPVGLDPLGKAALLQALAVAIPMTAAVVPFAWTTRTMARNRSVVARTRADHALTTSGPFAYVRHPISVAIALLTVGATIALGTWPRLIVGLPLYALGTWFRISEEERLLRTMFGAEHDAVAARVHRFVPRLF